MERLLSQPEDKIELLMADSVRVLCLCMGRLWLSEMKLEIEGFRRTVGREQKVDLKELKQAIERLVQMGTVEAEDRIRATMGGGEPDVLIGLKDYPAMLTSMRSDRDFAKYNRILDEVLG